MKGLAWIGGILGAIAIVAGVWALSYYVGIIGNRVHASYNKAVVTSQIQQNVNTADFAKTAYEGFFSECNQVVAMNGQIVNLQARLDAAKKLPDSYANEQAVGQAQTDLTGAQNQQLNIVADYNARSTEWTQGQFKDQNLPYRLRPPFDTVSCG